MGFALLAVAVAALAWLGVRGWMAYGELNAAKALTSELKASAAAMDADAAGSAADEMALHAARAAELTSDPVWRAAEYVPWLGPNFAAVRVVAQELDSVLSEAVVPLLSAARSISATAAAGGRIDLAPIVAQQEPITQASAALEQAAEHLEDVEAARLLPPVRDGFSEVNETVAQFVPIVSAVEDAARILPPILGSDGRRTILIMLQNNAELRTGGGITGSFVELAAEDGALTLVSQADSSEFKSSPTELLPVPASTTRLYGDRVGRFVQNASMSAEFPLTAQLVSTWWERHSGVRPDVLLSVDPMVLEAILDVTGPVSTGQGELSAGELQQKLLVDPYLALDQADQNVHFREVATSVFARLTQGEVDVTTLAAALAQPAEEGRIALWSAVSQEQEIIASTLLAGPSARQRLAGPDAFAIYLNDATGGKMDSFLDVTITSGSEECRPDGHRDVVVAVTLASDAPADAAGFPASMTGGGHFGTAVGDIATNVSVSAPLGSFFGGVAIGGELVPAVEVEDAGFPVTAVRVDLSPGETVTVEFRFVAADPGEVSPVILHTPLLSKPDVTSAAVTCR
ncbi:hypothetical protein ASD56_09365 [Microbacterium sp. Root166]|uniref:DUF4012 domain-containing protein n=1 Tax=Microbacterium sp. Root166 TaxID=1736478 RepID=UPI0006FAEEA9|nr:DUF4012 domain-containing protein [Microbacterium sp. Root166]KQZ84204.1 hypothetical protein ASD56_09365 [Microbacterium sp. Root166]